MSRSPWLLRKPQTEAPTRLFLFPYSGMGASMFAQWPTVVGDTELCRVQLPGRENRLREPHFGRYEDLAAALAEGLEPYLDRPFGFFGHCGGALAAVATARNLADTGRSTPDRIFVSSQVAPHRGPYGRFLNLSDEELVEELNRLLLAMGGTPNPELVAMNLGVLKADLAANRAYHLPEPVRLPGLVHAVGWTDDVEIPAELMATWEPYGRFTSTLLHGGHYDFLTAPANLMELLEQEMAHDAVPRLAS